MAALRAAARGSGSTSSPAEREHDRVVGKAYEEIINSVIGETEKIFAEEGIDSSLVQELRSIWEKKLARNLSCPLGGNTVVVQKSRSSGGSNAVHSTSDVDKGLGISPGVAATAAAVVVSHSVPGLAAVPHKALWENAPLRDTRVCVPTASGNQELFIRLPEYILDSEEYITQLHGLFASPVAGQAVSMTPEQAKIFLQRYINRELELPEDLGLALSADSIIPSSLNGDQIPSQLDGLDDSFDSSDEEDSSDDEDKDGADVDVSSDSADVSDEDDLDDEDEGDEKPLDSGDDLSEGDPETLFECENLAVCLFDKVSHIKNRWKFEFKSGIMTLNGKDYVFRKCTGDANW